MRLNLFNRVPAQYNAQTFSKLLQEIQNQLNSLSEARLAASYNATTAAPTTGDYAVGDIVRNSSPSQLGSAGSQYILLGWLCTNTDPLTFKELRCLTGN
jgi:hypothetical protein